MRTVKSRMDEPAKQTHEEIFSSPLGVSVVGVTTTFSDGFIEYSVYLEDRESPEKFDVLGVYDGTPVGENQSQATSFIAMRTLEALAELKGGVQ